MKNSIRLLLALVAAFAGLTVQTLRAGVEIGQPAPDFTLTDLDGKTHKLSDLKGKTVVLEWHNPNCPFVKKHYEKSGNIPATQKAATADGVVWLTINSGAPGKEGADFTAAQTKEYLQKNNAATTAYMHDRDGKVGHLYGAKTTPQIYVIDAKGTLVYNGAIDSIRSSNAEDIAKATNYATAALASVKAGKPVEKATSEPYGCSVKY
ncbi:MAG: redoxin domain-containing protein [Nibricoccus sp.]